MGQREWLSSLLAIFQYDVRPGRWDNALPLKLYLIRHGQTEWSLSGQHTGQTDLPLTTKGEFQASQLATLLNGIEFGEILTSPLQRARRTCELAALGKDAGVDPDLAEWNYGQYEGLTSVEIQRHHPNWNLFQDGAPSGESPADVAKRAQRVISRLSVLTGNVALFSHGHFFCALAMQWIGLPIIAATNFELATSSLSILSFAKHHPEVPVISGWNAIVKNA